MDKGEHITATVSETLNYNSFELLVAIVLLHTVYIGQFLTIYSAAYQCFFINCNLFGSMLQVY